MHKFLKSNSFIPKEKNNLPVAKKEEEPIIDSTPKSSNINRPNCKYFQMLKQHEKYLNTTRPS